MRSIVGLEYYNNYCLLVYMSVKVIWEIWKHLYYNSASSIEKCLSKIKNIIFLYLLIYYTNLLDNYIYYRYSSVFYSFTTVLYIFNFGIFKNNKNPHLKIFKLFIPFKEKYTHVVIRLIFFKFCSTFCTTYLKNGNRFSKHRCIWKKR